jgi:chromosomal replication initiation ATPase DnaA
LRISRFESEGATFNVIAETIGAIFNIPVEMLQQRHRGGIGSEARKTFAYVAAKEYNAPTRRIGEYLGVGNAAVSAMIHSGREIYKSRKITI